MSDLSRRKFIIFGATGIAALGVGSLNNFALSDEKGVIKIRWAKVKFDDDFSRSFGTKSKDLITCANLQPPTRSGNTLTCPSDDPDYDREYAALIRQELDSNGNVIGETALLEGMEYDPFDGSVVMDNGASSSFRYLSRMIRNEGSGSVGCDSDTVSRFSILSGVKKAGVKLPKVDLKKPPGVDIIDDLVGRTTAKVRVIGWNLPSSSEFDVLEGFVRRTEIDRSGHHVKRSLKNFPVVLAPELFDGEYEISDGNLDPAKEYVYRVYAIYELKGAAAPDPRFARRLRKGKRAAYVGT